MQVELYAIGAALISIAFAFYLSWEVNKKSQGEGKMVRLPMLSKKEQKRFLIDNIKQLLMWQL